MKFHFRLQKVLDHRENILKLAQRDFALAQGELIDAEKTLETFLGDVKDAEFKRHKLVQGGQHPGELLSQIHQYIKGMEIKIERQKTLIQQRLVKVEEMRLILQEKSIDCRILEKLKEKQIAEFRLGAKKKEEKQLSESANTQFYLRQGNE